MKNARQKRSEKAKTRKSTSIARSGGGADELLSRIEKADPDTHRQASSKSPKKRKGDTAYGGGGGFQLSTPKEFLIGAAALGGLGFVAYHAKKKNYELILRPATTTTNGDTPISGQQCICIILWKLLIVVAYLALFKFCINIIFS